MSYASKIAEGNRRPISIVEIGLDTKLSPSGVEYHCDVAAPIGNLFWQSVENINWTPTEIIPARGLGYRGVVTITFRDFSYGSKGTYFGKLFANNEYYLDRQLKIHSGFIADDGTFSWGDSISRLYFIKKIDGPDSNGLVKITAKDPLTLLDKDQATVPKKSVGSLNASITSTQTGTINIKDNDGFSASGGVAIIESEIVRYSGVSGADSIILDSPASSSRGQFGSEAVEHDADSPARECYAFENLNCVDVARSLIEDFTDIDHANYIPDNDWNNERDVFLSTELITGVIKEPTAVKSVIEKITGQTWVDIWWDDENQEIKLKSIGPNLASIKELDAANNTLVSGHKIKRSAEKAITQIWIYYDKIDYSKGDDPDNYKSLLITADPTLESAAGHGREKVKRIYGSYIGLNTATKVASRILESEGNGSTETTFQLDVKDSSIKPGETINLSTDLIQDVNGNPKRTSFRIVSKDQVNGITYSYKAVATGQDPDAKYGYIGPNTLGDYETETESNKATYCFIADDDGKMPNGDAPYLIL